MEFLPQQNRRCEGDTVDPSIAISAEGKSVLIIGGGDTGADCLGTSLRQHAKVVNQIEIMPKPPAQRAASTPWPLWPLQLRTESSHEEGGIRDWSVNSVRFEGDEQGNVKQVHALRVGLRRSSNRFPAPSSRWMSDLVLLAMGFLGPVRSGMIEQMGLALDNRATWPRMTITCPRWTASSPRVTCARAIAGSLGHLRRPQGRRCRRSLPGRESRAPGPTPSRARLRNIPASRGRSRKQRESMGARSRI